MKLIILAISLILLSSQLFGQDIKIVSVNDFSNDISGTSVEITGDKNDAVIYFDLKVINEGAPVDVKYQRIREVNSGRVDQVCDNSLCFDADDVYSYTSPILNTLETNVPSTFKPQLIPNGMESCAVHNYYVVTESGEALDSVTIIFRTTNANCNLSVDKNEEKTSMNIFPNPAKDFITIKSDALKNGGTIVFLDALGKEIKRSFVNSENTKLSVNDLKRGVYFVNIYGAAGTKSSVQRLIIQ
ncbi:T9SS type A sorting domain-containing protein [Brumimicrobium mesophilum]|uniref:T9SS type A sorting domain-containing protein n=1 Tax=Brumimicrobium mesophilum TaxID=392717 RepID=UPI000D1408C8|nr:T9SS type A sorting domain-containing protein [Brumimicrobium mesophilum]